MDSLEFLDLELASEIGRNACVSPTALIMALVYLERLSQNNPNYLTSVKPSELFVVALVSGQLHYLLHTVAVDFNLSKIVILQSYNN